MALPTLPPDFSEFLRSLNAHGVEYLVVGGHAVGYHGFPRTTGDLDIWVATTPENAARVAATVREFGFESPLLEPGLFQRPDQVVRMGVPPLRIEILTTISGVEFGVCYRARAEVMVGDLAVPFIGLEHLRLNKRAAGRFKDLDDLEHLG